MSWHDAAIYICLVHASRSDLVAYTTGSTTFSASVTHGDVCLILTVDLSDIRIAGRYVAKVRGSATVESWADILKRAGRVSDKNSYFKVLKFWDGQAWKYFRSSPELVAACKLAVGRILPPQTPAKQATEAHLIGLTGRFRL